MKVEFVSHMFLPQSSGGTEQYTHHIARALQQMGHSVKIFTADLEEGGQEGAPEIYTTNYESLALTRLRFSSWTERDAYGSHIFFNQDVYQSLIAHWRTDPPDIVHVTYCGEFTVAPLQAALDLKLPVIMTVTDLWLICPIGTALRPSGVLCTGRQSGRTCQQCIISDSRIGSTLDQLPVFVQDVALRLAEKAAPLLPGNSVFNLIEAIERRNRSYPDLLQRVSHLLAPSEFMRRMLVDSGAASADKVTTFPHGHDLTRARDGRNKSPSSKLRFGYTGHIKPIKGVDILIRAFRRLETLDASLVIWGNLDAEPEFGAHCKALAASDPRIRFAGRFDNQQIGRVLQEIDVVVVPSVCYENAPITIAEAFAAQTPVIATDLGGMAEAVTHEVDGLRFPLGDDVALAQQMKRLIDDPGLLACLRGGIRPVRTIEDEAAALVAIYSKLFANAERVAI